MNRFVVALALVVSACGGSTATTTAPPAGSTAPAQTAIAPDFTLALGEGGSFTLSEEQKPVYLVFWAEW